MKIKIDKQGLLWIERAGKMKSQACPFNSEMACGDWCPLFNDESLHDKSPSLELCRAFYSLDLQVIDERS